MKAMTRYFVRACATILCLIICACHYSGRLPATGFMPRSQSQKIDGHVEFVPGGQKLLPVQISATASIYNIDLSEAIDSGVRRILEAHFQVVQSGGGTKSFMRFQPSVRPRLLSLDAMSGNALLEVEIKVSATDAESNAVVDEIVAKEVFTYSPPGESAFLGFLTGLSLLTLSPITLPLNAQVCGDKAVKILEEGVDQLLAVVESEIAARQPRYMALALSQSVPGGGATANEVGVARSRYDGLMDCVVVVRSRAGFGSGFFVSADGHVLTNNHVVADDERPSIKLRDGQIVMATVVARDAQRDLAILDANIKESAWLRFADAGTVEVGAEVLAIGTPKGLSWSITKGVISGLQRGASGIYLQTDAAINTGNSGGPLIRESDGLVVGVNTAIMRGGGAEGLGFAVESRFARDFCLPFIK